MKQVILKSLTLNGYRGQNRHIEFSEGITEIYGRNKAGKSTILNAICQLLTRVDSKGRADYEMFDTNYTYTHEDNPPVEIIGVLTIDGYDYEIKQSAKLKWKRDKESDTWERGSGIDYTFTIDDVERSATAYKEWMESNLAPMEKLKCIVNPYHFIQNFKVDEWKVQRKMLADISGTITKADFKGDFSDLFEQLERYTITQLKERVSSQSKPLKARIGKGDTKGTLQIEIDTLEGSLPDISEVETAATCKGEIDIRIGELNDQKRGLNEPLEAALAERAKQRGVVETCKSAYREAKSAYNVSVNAGMADYRNAIHNIDGENKFIEQRNSFAKKEYDDAVLRHKTLSLTLKSKQEEIEKCRVARDENKAMEFAGDECTYCHQTLPNEMLEDARAKFNESQARALKVIVSRGKTLHTEIVSLEGEIMHLITIIDKGVILEQLKSKADAEAELAKAEGNTVSFDDTEEGKELLKAIADAEGVEIPLPTIDFTAIDEELKLLDIERTKCIETIAIQREYDKQILSIEDKKKELRASAQELANLEKTLKDIEAYNREYASIVQSRTNELFNRVEVNMLKESKSGEWVDACEVCYDGVPSKIFNNAEYTLSAIDIAQTFARYYGLNCFIFADNCESINNDSFPIIEGQMIKLYVSEDVELKVKSI